MTARLLTAIRSLGRRFLRQSGGSVAPLLALSLVPIIGAAGAAIDFSRAPDARVKLQAAVDAAVLAGAADQGHAGGGSLASRQFPPQP